MTYRRLASILIILAFILPVLSTLPAVVPAQGAIAIISAPSHVYPGDPVTVEVDVGFAAPFTIYLKSAANPSTVWASQTIYPPTAGRYKVTLILPKSLPDIGAPAQLLIEAEMPAFSAVDQKFVDIYPKIEVAPTAATIVDNLGHSNVVTVYGYGFDDGASITSIDFIGPSSSSKAVSITVGNDGTFTATVDLLNDLPPYEGLARGNYDVNVTTDSYFASEIKTGSLQIKPQILVHPNTGNGRCDSSYCELTALTFEGYGFGADTRILKVEFINTNFSNVVYVFEFNDPYVLTDSYGYFTVTDLADYLKTNLTAGMYIFRVYEAPKPATLSSSAYIPFDVIGTVTIGTSDIYNAVGTHANVTAKFYASGSWKYVVKSSVQSYTVSETLKINITEVVNNKVYKYQITAKRINPSLINSNVSFALYNITTLPYVQLFSINVTPVYDALHGGYNASVKFNITPSLAYTSYTGPVGDTFLGYRYIATFYSYSTQILLMLREWSLVIDDANLTITYINTDTDTTKEWYYNYTLGNLTLVDSKLTIDDIVFTDANIKWTIEFVWDSESKIATLTVTMEPLNAVEYEFKGTYYLVRPVLILLTPGPLKPGDTVTIVAYGYGPGEAWGYSGKNTLHVSFDKVKFLGDFSLGRDGNVTFSITIPDDATYGAHYIWGVDDWGYEYSLAIIIGAKAFWTVINGTTGVIIASRVVSAGLDNKRVEVCPCDTYKASTFCGECVVYGGACDYLGDIIRVFITGLSPNETVDIYFGSIKVAEAKADNTGAVNTTFVVPTVPEGDYVISAEASISGHITFVWYNGTHFLPYTVHVAPKILLVSLSGNHVPVLVGPGIVKVIGTGFTPGVAITGVLVNETDALLPFNANVQRWTANASGVLYSPYSKELGLYIPVLQPGKYEVKLTYIKGNDTYESLAGVVYVVNNLTNVATKDQLAGLATKDDVETAKDAIIVAVNNAASTVVSSISRSIDSLAMSVDDVLSEVKASRATLLAAIITVNETVKRVGGQASVDLSPVLSAISDLKGKVDSLSSKVDTVAGKVDSVASSVSSLSGKIDSISAKVDSLSGKVDSVSSKVDSATNSIVGAISQVANKVAEIDGKADAIATGVSEASGKADTIFYTSIVIAILALLAMIFAVLAYSTIKKSIAPAAK